MKQRIITTLTVLLMTVMGVQAGVKIGNKDITADGTVSSTYIKSGSVSYNSATNTLTLNNATITINSGSGNAAIDFTTDGTLVIIGTNSVSGGIGLQLNVCNVTIQLNNNQSGSATFVGGSDNCGIYVPSNSTLTINQGCSVTVQGGWGIAGYNGTLKETVVINSATVHATGTQGSICDLQTFTMNDCGITSPVGAAFNSSQHAVCVGTTKVTSEVVIEPTHDGIPIDAEHFPNATFRNYISSTSANYDRDGDGYLSDDEISMVTWMNVASKNISDLTGIEYFTAMTSLYCHNNPLGTLDLSGCKELRSLQCNGCQLTSLIVPQSITSIQCYNNRIGFAAMNALIESLPNVSTGVFMVMLASGTDQNVCTQGHVAAAQAKGWNVYNSSNQAYSGADIAINGTNFPDANFRSYISDNLDTDHNGELSQAEIAAVTVIDVRNMGINDLTGIGFFPYLKELYCMNTDEADNDNHLTSLDLSDNPELTYVGCGQNGTLASLNITNCAKLENLHCASNNLTTLDVTHNPKLWRIYCANNKLTTLNLSNNTALTNLICGENQLTSLDLSNNTALTYLSCYSNQLTSLNASNNSALTYLSCSNNQLTSLNVSSYTALTWLACHENQLTSLDVSNCSALEELYCYENPLTSLNASNNIALTRLDCHDTPLTSLNVSGCTALTNLYCYNNQLISLDVSGCSALTKLSCFNNQLTSLNVSNCTALMELYCYDNQLTSLNVSNNTALTSLYCFSNQLTSLDVSNNTALTYLSCNENQLTELDLSNNTALTSLSCHQNQLTSLNVSGYTTLIYLSCYLNQLNSLNVSGCSALTTLYCDDNQLTSLNVSGCSALTTIACDGNQIYGDAMTNLVVSLPTVSSGDFYVVNLSNANEQNVITKADANIATGKGWTVKTAYGGDPFAEGIAINETNFPDANFRSSLQSFYDKDGNAILSEAEIAAVERMEVHHKGITDLTGINYFTALTELDCRGNNLTSLDLSGFTKLEYLHCSENQLTWLDVSGCTGLTYLDCCANSIKREAMEAIVRSLPTINDGKGNILVYNEEYDDGNECTEKHVFGLEMKNWDVYYYDKTKQTWLPYAGINEASGGANGDINGDNKVDIADVTALVDIVLRNGNGSSAKALAPQKSEQQGLKAPAPDMLQTMKNTAKTQRDTGALPSLKNVARERKVTSDRKSARAMDGKLTKQPMMPDMKLKPQAPKHPETYEVM